MHTVRITKLLHFGENVLSEAEYQKNDFMVITAPPEVYDKWLSKLVIHSYR